ncbi:M20 metallopeptidase family protein [Salsuginibacillus kocurii]|uniref:M20 metallopeptidase family protein n=1 Tax=Salsuginibacillus kocurii TaxID=427078 RepID=UPI00036A06CF|nr:M20 family metallopeptidase [Salsuginibacillus kocurii]
MQLDFRAQAAEIQADIIQLRRTLHQYPELSFQEKKTSQFVKQELEKLNYATVYSGKNETGVETGIVAVFNADSPSKAVALRADMDALPIQEENDISYRSKHEGIMHACGHDAHTAILLGCAQLIDKACAAGMWPGKVKLIFQPAEEAADVEGKSGSSYMIEAGVLKDVEKAFALHMDPEYPLGTIRLHEGASMANVDTFTGIVRGTGGHGAYPETGTDPVYMLSYVLPALYGITSRAVSPLAKAVVSVCTVKGGESTNVIPSAVEVSGTFRSYDDETRDQLTKEVKQAFEVVKSFGGRADITVEHGEPALVNDEEALGEFHRVIGDSFSEYEIKNEPYGLGGEDFGYMAREVPAAFAFVGAAVENGGSLHMPTFNINENILPEACALLTETAYNTLVNLNSST